MIPKIIHYCWLSDDPFPPKIQKCVNSWKTHLVDYEFWLWDLKRFDINSSKWVEEAFNAKKYAFASDYIRCFALYHHGGIYLDCDVEVIKPFDDLLNLPYFFGYESAGYIEAATMGSKKENPLFSRVLEYYEGKNFIDSKGEQDITILPKILMEIIDSNYTKITITNQIDFDYSSEKLSFFQYDFFSPIDTLGKKYVLRSTENTYSIHHFVSAWVSWEVKFLILIFGNTQTMLRVKKVLSFFKNNFYKRPKWALIKFFK